MTPTKLLIGQILIVFAIMVLGVWAATQWAAAMLAYQPELGSPWFFVREFPVYRPGSLWRARQSRFVTTYGSARWASDKEIARAGLFGDVGVFLGRLQGSYLRHD